MLWGVASRKPAGAQALKLRLDRRMRREIWLDASRRDEASLRAAARVLAEHAPSALVAYTQAAVELARLVVQDGLRTWADMAVVCGAEPFHAGDRELLACAFGPRIYETYGCREMMLLAAECEHHAGMHESMENVFVEIVVTEPSGRMRHAEPGETGEVVLTDLHNRAMPFIRYANGDRAIAGPGERCACGRGLRRIQAVDGRTTDTLRDATGRPVGGMLFNLVFSPLANRVRQFQAVQHRDGSITVRVVPSAALQDGVIEEVQSSCGRYLQGVQLDVCVVDDIPLTASGKRRPVIVET
jgi:phenylacetate-CoA ligase